MAGGVVGVVATAGSALPIAAGLVLPMLLGIAPLLAAGMAPLPAIGAVAGFAAVIVLEAAAVWPALGALVLLPLLAAGLSAGGGGVEVAGSSPAQAIALSNADAAIVKRVPVKRLVQGAYVDIPQFLLVGFVLAKSTKRLQE